MSKQPILHIISGDLWGGAEAQVLTLVSTLRSQGIPAEVLLFNEGEVSRRFRHAGIPLHIVSEAAGPVGFLSKVFPEIAQAKPKIIVAHGYKEAMIAAPASRRLSVPWVAVFHGTTELLPGLRGLKLKAYRLIHRLLARYSAAHIITVSQTMAEDLGFASLGKTSVIRNVSRPRQADFGQAALGENGQMLKHPAILVLGRLAPVKRVDRAIKAFAALCALQQQKGTPLPYLYIAGDGPLKAQLCETAAKSGWDERIFFLGYRDDTELLLRESELLLLTSDSEGMPTVLLEAIAIGTPAVCTSVGGIPEVLSLIPDFPAQLFVADEVQTAANMMAAQLLKTRDEEQLQRARAQFEQHFAPEVAAEAHKALYRKLLSET